MTRGASLSDLRNFGVATALEKWLKQVTQDMRAQLDQVMRTQWEQGGDTQKRININGVDFGSLTARISKPSKEVRVRVTDPKTLITEDYEQLVEFVRQNKEQYAEWLFTQQGIIPQGCELEEYEVPGGQYLGFTVRGCSPEHLGAVVGDALPEYIAGFLEQGEGE